jgi:hypothetical protein
LTAPAPATGTRLVHLVWAPLGPQPLARFLESYRRYPSGAQHDLLVLLNGFEPDQDLTPWRDLLAGIEYEEMRLARPLLDLAAYREVAAGTSARRYCFLNSYCVLRADGWLALLERVLDQAGAGLVGPSGSWGSIRSYNRFMLGLGGPYAHVFGDRRETGATLAAVAARNEPDDGGGGRAPLRFARALLERSWGFQAFPAPHIRTSAFMIDADVLRLLRVPALKRKADALRLENGRDSITAQVARLGLRALVVGRDGRGYSEDEWPESETFWQGEQQNLLIADKQTDDYALGDAAAREALSRYAWGGQARPTGPPAPALEQTEPTTGG